MKTLHRVMFLALGVWLLVGLVTLTPIGVAAQQTVRAIVADTELPAAATLADDTANPSLPAIASYNMCYDGSTWDRCPPDPAHDAADTGNPLKIGGKALTGNTGSALPAANDRVNATFSTDGGLVIHPHTLLEDVVQERTTNTDGASTAFASGLAAPGANVRLWITKCTLSNSSASFITVDLRDGSAGSVLWTVPVPATGGAVENFGDIPLRLTANTALAFDASGATTTLTIACNGFKSRL